MIRFLRSKKYESATACPPIHLGDNYVFLSECYDKGSVVLQIKPNFSYDVAWENSKLGIHWMTPIGSKGYLYGVSGRHQQGAELFCLNWKTGETLWKEIVLWQENLLGRDLNLQLFRAEINRNFLREGRCSGFSEETTPIILRTPSGIRTSEPICKVSNKDSLTP